MRLSSNMNSDTIVNFLEEYLEENTKMSEHNRHVIISAVKRMADDAAKVQMHTTHVIDLQSEIKELKEEITNLGYEMINQANLNDL